MSYEGEVHSFTAEVQREAERMIRDGEAAPVDAVIRARQIVMERRQQKARQRQMVAPEEKP